jgi:hypothetical protein
MNQTRAAASRTPAEIATEVRAELRSILRARRDLYTPIDRFEPIAESGAQTRYYVLFDLHRRIPIQGLKFGGLKQLKLPDEGIHDRVLELAKAIWHLKDRLHQYARAINRNVAEEALAQQDLNLLVCADLANKSKHGRNENRSKLNPHLDLVTFDTSNCGSIELYYDGAMKEKELIVGNPVPIPFHVDVLIHDGNAIFGDVREILSSAMNGWLPVIQTLGVLSADDSETKALYTILFRSPDADQT